MSAIGSVSGNSDNQWQLLQQLRASRAAETLAGTGATGTKASGAGAPAAASSPAVLPAGTSQSGATAATGTASGTSGLFDTVAAKLMSGMQSFLVDMQAQSSTGSGSNGALQGYGKSFTNAATSSARAGLSA